MRGRGAAMSQKMRQIKAANPGLPQTQMLSTASKLSGKQSNNGGFLPVLPMALSALGGLVIPKLISAVTGSGISRSLNKGRGLTLGHGMDMKPYR